MTIFFPYLEDRASLSPEVEEPRNLVVLTDDHRIKLFFCEVRSEVGELFLVALSGEGHGMDDDILGL